MAESPFAVTASAGSLRDAVAIADPVVLAHAWTPQGALAGPAANGGQLLHLAIAMCVLNDTFREAQRLGVTVDGVSVAADGGFDQAWASTGVTYAVRVDSPAPAEQVEKLLAVVDEVAEIPKAVRAGASVVRR